MPETPFVEEITGLVADLKKVSKKLDVSHINAEGMEETMEVGVPFNKALSYIESARELVDQASNNLNLVIKASQKSKKKHK